MFIHAGCEHFWGNLFMACIYGYFLELHLNVSWKILCLIFVISGWFSLLFVLSFTPSYCCGASGAICGLTGCYLVNLFIQPKTALKDFISCLLIVKAIVYLIQDAISFTKDPNMQIGGTNVAHGAHFGGMLAGFLLGIVFLNPKHCKRVDNKTLLIVRVVLLSILAAFAGLLFIYFMVEGHGLFYTTAQKLRSQAWKTINNKIFK